MTCAHDDCDTQPIYGVKGERATHCTTHKDPITMVDVRHPLCTEADCNTRASYGVERGQTPTHCMKHGKPVGLQNLVLPICKNNDCTTSVNHNYKPYCAVCYYELNPDAERTINFKTKEIAFMEEVKKQYPEVIHDRVIKGGKSRRRPDGLLRFANHCVIVEIDEAQHSCYDTQYEFDRLLEIQTDLDSMPMIVIRLNPDGYKNESDKRVKGCFSVSKKTKKLERNNKEFKRRVAILLEHIDVASKSEQSTNIEIKPLFYDGY